MKEILWTDEDRMYDLLTDPETGDMVSECLKAYTLALKHNDLIPQDEPEDTVIAMLDTGDCQMGMRRTAQYIEVYTRLRGREAQMFDIIPHRDSLNKQ